LMTTHAKSGLGITEPMTSAVRRVYRPIEGDHDLPKRP